MNEVTFAILKIVVSVCAALITAYAIPYIKALRNDARYKQVIDIIELAVHAAEQTITESGKGAEKKQKVIEFVKEWMDKAGIHISVEEISELTEAAVFQMKQGQKK